MTEFGDVLRVTIDDTRLKALGLVAPKVVAEELRDAVGGIFGSTRRAFMAQIPHPGIKRLAQRSVFYTVYPRSGAKAARAPEDVLGVFHATSDAPGRHEFGGTFRAQGQLMPIPIGTKGARLRSKALKSGADPFKKRGRGLVEGLKRAIESSGQSVVFLKNRAGDTVMYARERPKVRPAPVSGARRGRPRKHPVKLVPLLVFKRQVTLPPRLGLYDTWRAQSFDRVQRLNRAVEKAVARLSQGVRETLAG